MLLATLFFLLSLSLLCISLVCHTLDLNVPFNINLYESHHPEQLADSLIARPPKNRSYERLFVARKHQDGLDEYICEYAPFKYQLPEERLAKLKSDFEILNKATQLIHLSFSRDSCVWAYELRGRYWTYAYCFGDKVIQYHEGAAYSERPKKHLPVRPETVFILGRFTKASLNRIEFKNQASESQFAAYLEQAPRSYRLVDEKLSPFSHHSSQRVVLQIVEDGTLCDMTWQPRTIEMMYLCSEVGGTVPEIMRVEEIQTCYYKMVLHVPTLCTYEHFIPNRQAKDALVNVACQKIDTTGVHVDRNGAFDDFIPVNVLRDDEDFPVRADNRVDVSLHRLDELSWGFYVAHSNTKYNSTSAYFKNRAVILFNGEFTDLDDLNYQFGNAMYRAIGSTFKAYTPTNRGVELLDFLHMFVLWFEIYDTAGEFIGLSRIENAGNGTTHMLNIQMVDPVELMGTDGDDPLFVRFARPEFQAPLNKWNFEVLLDKLTEPYVARSRLGRYGDVLDGETLDDALDGERDTAGDRAGKEKQETGLGGQQHPEEAGRERDGDGRPYFVEDTEQMRHVAPVV